MTRQDIVWKSPALVRTYLEGVRAGIPFGVQQIDIMLRVVAARGEPVARFADLGCGGGALARALLGQYPKAQATLVDFSEPMLAEARRGLGTHAPAPQFVLADLATPQWTERLGDSAAFDVIVSGYAIHHLPHPRKRALYGEIFRRLLPGGVFVNVEHVASPSAWIESIADALMIDSLYAAQQRQGSARTRAQVADEFVHRPDKAANILAPVEEQCAWLRAIGFEDVDCYFKALELAVFGGRVARGQAAG
jgi:tRNA (cmo5U34)-methyltransferase